MADHSEPRNVMQALPTLLWLLAAGFAIGALIALLW